MQNSARYPRIIQKAITHGSLNHEGTISYQAIGGEVNQIEQVLLRKTHSVQMVNGVKVCQMTLMGLPVTVRFSNSVEIVIQFYAL